MLELTTVPVTSPPVSRSFRLFHTGCARGRCVASWKLDAFSVKRITGCFTLNQMAQCVKSQRQGLHVLSEDTIPVGEGRGKGGPPRVPIFETNIFPQGTQLLL